MTKRFIPHLRWLVAALIVIAPILLIVLWPMSYWFEVDTIHVNDSRVGEPITLLVNRKVNRPFAGTYLITIHKWNPNGPESFCTMQGGTWPYRTDSVYPVPLTLEWWTEGDVRCNRQVAGQFQMTTEWVKPGNWLLPDKRVSFVSNIYRVSP